VPDHVEREESAQKFGATADEGNYLCQALNEALAKNWSGSECFLMGERLPNTRALTR